MSCRASLRGGDPGTLARIVVGSAAMIAAASGIACSPSPTDQTPGTDLAGTTVGPSDAASVGSPGTSVPFPTNDAIEAALDAEHPAEHDLVDWTLFTREPMAGYRVPVADGTDRTQAVAVCAAVVEALAASGARADIEVLSGPTVLAAATSADPTCAAR